MKKLYTTFAGSDLKLSRFPFIKILSLTSIAALLSSVSPVFSKSLDSNYKGSIDVSHDNYITALNSVQVSTVDGLNDHGKFLTRTLVDVSDDNVSLATDASALGEKSIAIGYRATSKNANTISIGTDTSTSSDKSIALGMLAQAMVDSGVAIGAYSLANVAGAIVGYSPFIKGNSNNLNSVWKSTLGAVSVGDNSTNQSRQIIGLAAGTKDSDAVNVAQLKSLQDYVDKGWKLYINGDNAEAVAIDSIVDFSAGGANLEITKETDKKSNKIKFDLAKNITLESVKAGENIFNATGLIINNGPQVTADGMNAGSKKITNVATGTDETDAVNFAQLQKVEQEIEKHLASGGLVKQDPESKDITIGGGTDGGKVNIANKDDEDRRLSGVKAGEKANEAVNKGQLDQGLKELTNSLQSDGSAVVHYDKTKDGSVDYTNVTLGKNKDSDSVGLHNVADGKVSKDSHDAINGGQLEGLSQDITKALGGDAKFADGKFSEPTYTLSDIDKDGKVGTMSYHDAGSALAGLDKNINNVNNNLTNKFDKLSQNVGQATQQLKDDALLWSSSENAFVADHGAEGKKLSGKITHLLNGEITQVSTDAINGSQLYSLNQTLASYLGGGAKFENNTWTAPHFTVKGFDSEGNATEESYDNVAGAFEGFNSSLTNIHDEMSNALNTVEGNNLVKQDPESKNITIGGEREGDEVNIANKDHEDRRLSGIKAGEKANEAVNKGQLDQGLKELTNSLQSDGSAVVHYDQSEDGSIDYTSVTLGKAKGSASVGLHNVADGQISAGSHDAINGGQLEVLSQDIAKALGGDAKFADGKFSEPTYTLSDIDKDGEVGSTSYHDAGSALAGLDKNINNVNNNLTNKFDELSQNVGQATQQLKDDALLWSSNEKAFVADHGAEGEKTASKITHLLNGEITQASTDAINGSQLYSLNQTLASYFGGSVKYENGEWTAPNFTITSLNDDGTSEEKSYDSVAKAFAAMNTSFTKLHTEMSGGVEQNALLWNDKEEAFLALHGQGDEKSNSKIKYLLDGDISKGSTEAITGNQLYDLKNQFASYFGGGAGYDDEGNWKAPSFTLKTFTDNEGESVEKTYHDVAGAFEGVNQSMSNINNRIKKVEDASSNGLNWDNNEGAYNAARGDNKSPSKIINLEDGKIEEGSQEAVNGGQLWKTEQKVKEVKDRVDHVEKQVNDMDTKLEDLKNTVTDGVVSYDKGEDGKKSNKITLVGGDESAPVVIDKVADGKIEKDSQEAVNGGQLYSYTKEQMDIVLDNAKTYTDEKITNITKSVVDEANAYTDMKFSSLSYAVENVRKEARQAAAIGLAVSNLRYSDIPGKLTAAFGAGLWRSQSAFAFGTGYTSENGNINSNLSITSSGGHWGIGGGFSLILN
ncbi:Vomp family autotransporter [Bartonella raoultii]|uniref:Vomp family autotransporter n=1 Tax=Bartonella raoultii TaxID=1457020 RepID=A0ABS7I3W2_9HYPH|nr:Vomp family autotransporter [Bartonella raoultii]MBX4335404.1 Vomp family autotransporter [Bartonella raoultii]